MKKRYIILLTGCAVLLLCGGFWFFTRNGESPVQLQRGKNTYQVIEDDGEQELWLLSHTPEQLRNFISKVVIYVEDNGEQESYRLESVTSTGNGQWMLQVTELESDSSHSKNVTPTKKKTATATPRKTPTKEESTNPRPTRTPRR